MTKSVGVHEAKTHLSRLLEEVEAGASVDITNRGRVVARLVPVETVKKTPNWGWARGQGWVADDFDAPLPDDLQAMFEGD
jgi:prevent-host-death family protein